MSILKTISKYKRYRNTVKELSRMTDRELNDIGISRGDINRVASETVF